MKYVAIVSGGMDSVTLLAYLRHQRHAVRVLSFDYGQRHVKELKYAQRICTRWHVEQQIINLRQLTPLLNRSALTSTTRVPHGHYEAPTMKLTVVPNRNMIMLSIAIGYAANLKFDGVAIANHAGDHAIYPDCRPAFIKALNRTSQLATYEKIQLFAPFTDWTKGQIAAQGLKLGLDYDRDTWSCYEGGKKACGKCGTDVERREALAYAAAHA